MDANLIQALASACAAERLRIKTAGPKQWIGAAVGRLLGKTGPLGGGAPFGGGALGRAAAPTTAAAPGFFRRHPVLGTLGVGAGLVGGQAAVGHGLNAIQDMNANSAPAQNRLTIHNDRFNALVAPVLADMQWYAQRGRHREAQAELQKAQTGNVGGTGWFANLLNPWGRERGSAYHRAQTMAARDQLQAEYDKLYQQHQTLRPQATTYEEMARAPGTMPGLRTELQQQAAAMRRQAGMPLAAMSTRAGELDTLFADPRFNNLFRRGGTQSTVPAPTTPSPSPMQGYFSHYLPSGGPAYSGPGLGLPPPAASYEPRLR